MSDIEQFVYFVRSVESHRIKIGIAADPIRRMALMQVGSPEQLELIGVVTGGRKLELHLHAELRHDRLHGEWFECSDHLVYVMGNLLGWGQLTALTAQQMESARKAAVIAKRLELFTHNDVDRQSA